MSFVSWLSKISFFQTFVLLYKFLSYYTKGWLYENCQFFTMPVFIHFSPKMFSTFFEVTPDETPNEQNH